MNPRSDAELIFRAALASVDPAPLIRNCLSIHEGQGRRELVARSGAQEARYLLTPGSRIFATGMGKAAARMAAGLEAALGGDIAGGLVAVRAGSRAPLKKVRLVEGGHPLPDEGSCEAGRAILSLGPSLGTQLTVADLVVVLVSGGGSALLCAPAEGLSLGDKIEATSLLLASGATINEVNCLRKHLSAVKGGRLAAALAPARVLALVLSDVVGDDLDVIASGPTVPDPTSYAEALAIVGRHGLSGKLPGPVLALLERGAAGLVPETPKPGDPVFAAVRTMLVGTNRLALAAATAEAQRLGYNSLVLSSRVTGEAREAALVFLGIGKDIAASGFPLERPACLISGGETTVTLRGGGRGGRNQEMALSFLSALGRSPRDGEGLTFLAAGTDGMDGPTDAAGAIVDLELYRKALREEISPEVALADNDSYCFFSRAGGHLKTGATDTNVCDVQVLIVP